MSSGIRGPGVARKWTRLGDKAAEKRESESEGARTKERERETTSSNETPPFHSSTPPSSIINVVHVRTRRHLRMSLHDMLEVLLPHRRVGKEGANELGDLLRREIDEVAVVEEEEDVGLRASAVSNGEVEEIGRAHV